MSIRKMKKRLKILVTNEYHDTIHRPPKTYYEIVSWSDEDEFGYISPETRERLEEDIALQIYLSKAKEDLVEYLLSNNSLARKIAEYRLKELEKKDDNSTNNAFYRWILS